MESLVRITRIQFWAGKIRIVGYFIVFVLLFTSCGVFFYPGEVKDKLTYCYDSASKDLPVKLNGIYVLERPDTGNISCIDTLQSSFIFYQDGTVVFNCPIKWLSINSVSSISKPKIIGGGDWGIYKFENDTIKAQFLEPLGGTTWPRKGETWFKILDNTTIQGLYLTYEKTIDASMVKKQKREYIFKFYKLDNIPDSDLSWIKRKKWFWCDKKEFKVWKKQHK
jgi:hypothetical protein